MNMRKKGREKEVRAQAFESRIYNLMMRRSIVIWDRIVVVRWPVCEYWHTMTLKKKVISSPYRTAIAEEKKKQIEIFERRMWQKIFVGRKRRRQIGEDEKHEITILCKNRPFAILRCFLPLVLWKNLFFIKNTK